METLRVHDVDIPVIGFGTWEVTGDSAYESVRTALELGYRHVDTARLYGNEEEVGRAIADSGVDRDEVFLTTKVWIEDAAHDDVLRAGRESLDRLGADYVDLLLIHWPTDVAPIEETVEALDELREQGATRLIGVSNYTSDQLKRALKAGPVATNQVEYHPMLDQDAVLEVVRDAGIALTAYSPLAHGRLVGDETLEEIGAAHDKTGAQVALRWLLEQDRVVAIPRSEDPGHIADNLDVFDFTLSDGEMARIDALPKDRRQVDPPIAPDWD